MTRISFFVVSILFFINSCEKNPIENGEPFQVSVVDEEGKPIAAATIEGGVDWDYFKVKTNTDGKATLPARARRERATIYKTNYFPQIIHYLGSGLYTLKRTPQTVQLIGSIEGKEAIYFNSNTIITFSYIHVSGRKGL